MGWRGRARDERAEAALRGAIVCPAKMSDSTEAWSTKGRFLARFESTTMLRGVVFWRGLDWGPSISVYLMWRSVVSSVLTSEMVRDLSPSLHIFLGWVAGHQITGKYGGLYVGLWSLLHSSIYSNYCNVSDALLLVIAGVQYVHADSTEIIRKITVT